MLFSWPIRWPQSFGAKIQNEYIFLLKCNMATIWTQNLYFSCIVKRFYETDLQAIYIYQNFTALKQRPCRFRHLCQNFNLLPIFQPITGEQTIVGQPQPRFYSQNGKFSKGRSLSIESIPMICKIIFVYQFKFS